MILSTSVRKVEGEALPKLVRKERHKPKATMRGPVVMGLNIVRLQIVMTLCTLWGCSGCYDKDKRVAGEGGN